MSGRPGCDEFNPGKPHSFLGDVMKTPTVAICLFLLVAFASLGSAQVQTCQTFGNQQGFNFVPDCAVSAAQAFQNCRSNGGRPLPCFFEAAITYVGCPGVITRQRLRQRRQTRMMRRRGY